MKRLFWLLICFGFVCAASGEDVRTWTDDQGRKMQAQFVREVDGDVTFLKDGKLVTLPLDKLSLEDQKFIRDAESNKKVEETAPPAGAPKPADNSPFSSDAPAPGDSKASLAKKITAEERTWRDLRGKPQVGKFVRMHQGFVVISSGARAIRVPYYNLSQPDRDYLRELLTARGELAQLPTARPVDEVVPSTEQAGGEPAQPSETVSAPVAVAPPEPPQPRGGPGMGRGAPVGSAGGTAMPSGNDRLARMQEESRKRMDEMHERNQQTIQQNRERAQRSLERLHAAANPSQPESPQDVVGSCSNCRNSITREQSSAKKCPHCGVIWEYEVDRFGHKKEIPGAKEAIAAENASGGSTSSARTGWEWESRHTVKLFTRIIIPLVVMLFAAIGAAVRGKR